MRAATVIPISIQRMVCIACGAEANASCNCGVAYQPKSIRAREAVEANPEKSNRAIAEETGISEATVRRARASSDAPESVVGKDGKSYPARRIDAEASAERLKEPLQDGEDDEHFTLGDYFEAEKRARKLEERVNKLVVALNSKEVTEGRNWPLDKMTKKHLKKRDDALGAIAYWQKILEKLYAEVTGQPVWRVEVINKEGKRFANGLRFALRDEAEGYARKREEMGQTAEVIACEGEEPNVEVNGENIHFQHGDCVLFNWEPVA
jgi:hypothetical protein